MAAEEGWTEYEMGIVKCVAARLRGDYHDDMTDPDAIIVAGWVLIVWDFAGPYKIQFYDPNKDTLAPIQVGGTPEKAMAEARAWAEEHPISSEWCAAASHAGMESAPCA